MSRHRTVERDATAASTSRPDGRREGPGLRRGARGQPPATGRAQSPASGGSATRRILVVDDEKDAADELAAILRQDGYLVETVGSAEEALQRFSVETYHVLITDLLLPGKSGVELTRQVHEACPGCAIVLITGHATVKTAVAALKRGAADYIRKPVQPRLLRERVQALLEMQPDYLPNRLLARSSEMRLEGMVARSRVMQNVFDKIRLAAQSDATVLVTGESGTGKELVARAIHNLSARAGGPFVAVHTGAIPRDLIASELFGHERGSFTGAIERKEGKFELAEGGTIFLDEISTMDERTQINLLRILETFAYMRIGGKRERRADVRVVAATNRDLAHMVAQGTFREDLYYRLNILQIALPPLRERREDIPVLAHEFIAHFAAQYRKPLLSMPPETQRLLESYPWPGNIRELRNVIEQAVLLARSRQLEPELLPQMIFRSGPSEEVIRIPLGWTMREAEKEIILRTLQFKDGNKKITAQVLGISRRSLYNKLAEYEQPLQSRHQDHESRRSLS
ncbi:MAG: sigma-54 dependent transcriptional regulator [Myxococcales bacterium]|nr:sigma-54 dependent transcriptional regulator [Myxococcota bacterium]MDW8281421.1 sigma-54 dependent transcriptional regulator [Myxococcales bacterium]